MKREGVAELASAGNSAALTWPVPRWFRRTGRAAGYGVSTALAASIGVLPAIKAYERQQSGGLCLRGLRGCLGLGVMRGGAAAGDPPPHPPLRWAEVWSL